MGWLGSAMSSSREDLPTTAPGTDHLSGVSFHDNYELLVSSTSYSLGMGRSPHNDP